ncbi:hypothetical protein A8C75_03355 [Marinobacterium aestuarii]|uniref:Porin domain-containing protein n=1 Tax=Marinobacterium aestuarii TaxID=1821621 RepID=A0A1A9EUN5_9GAMM|nr:hypothetical protein [Marinobacterium aestuarii]ANG61605.1 hypothetical protein A8C75_03355 [Marinobacterium aestuarii]
MGFLRSSAQPLLCLCLLAPPALADGAIDSHSVDIAASYRAFAHGAASPADAGDYRRSPGLQGQMDASGRIGDADLKLRLFGSWDAEDESRRYADIRQASAQWRHDRLSFSAGVGTFFWGVSESINVVNVLNQADLRQAVDGKDKLGQTFASMSLRFDTGELSLYYLPTFREREFSQRPSFGLPVSDHAQFESSDHGGELALRSQLYLGDLEVGLGYFKGTRRAPLLISSGSARELTPWYIETENLLLDALYLVDDTILKLEAKTGRERGQGFFSANIGLEVPVYSLPDGLQDLSLIAEYLIDDRDEQAESLGQNDLFIGLKSTFGDIGNSQFRGLVSYDFDSHANYLDLSLNHRLNDYVRIETRALLFLNATPEDSWLYPVRDEDFIEIKLHYSF